MSNPLRITIVVTAAMLAVITTAPACRPSPEQPKQIKEEPEVVDEAELSDIHEIEVVVDTKEVRWSNIKPIKVRRGQGVRFVVKEHTAWFLIPETGFRRLSGGSDWVVGDSITAFKVEKGSALVTLDNSFQPVEPNREIHYSVLVRNSNDKWEYVHGENPPPKMIIPPHQ
jgi:hypothetical protein